MFVMDERNTTFVEQSAYGSVGMGEVHEYCCRPEYQGTMVENE